MAVSFLSSARIYLWIAAYSLFRVAISSDFVNTLFSPSSSGDPPSFTSCFAAVPSLGSNQIVLSLAWWAFFIFLFAELGPGCSSSITRNIAKGGMGYWIVYLGYDIGKLYIWYLLSNFLRLDFT